MKKESKTIPLCDRNCNECVLMQAPNAKILTAIFNVALDEFGDKFGQLVQRFCPNLTCCYECHIDDFCHVEGCEILKAADAEMKK